MKKRKKVTAKKVVKPANKLFPGLPHYTGPQRGYFGFVHHGKLFEKATEDIKVRIAYIRSHKPNDEQRIRLRHVIYLGKSLSAKIEAWDGNGWSRKPANDGDLRKAVLAYAARHIEPLRWKNDANYGAGTLVKANGQDMTG